MKKLLPAVLLSALVGGVGVAVPHTYANATQTVYYPITISEPEAGEDFQPGEPMEIRWSPSAHDSMGMVNIHYSLDGGITFTEIIRNLQNDGLHSWTVPSTETRAGHILVEGTDGQVVLTIGLSDAFAIDDGHENVSVGREEEPTDNNAGEDDEVRNDDDGEVILPTDAFSPVTGEMESVDMVAPGDYIRGKSFDTVYWVDEDHVRHPFMDAQTFFTYEDSFNAITEVTDATLTTLPVGSPMLPKAGTVLVKVQSIEKVYALESDMEGVTTLRWLSSEDVAEETYGEDWADHVIDVSVVLFDEFVQGEAIDGSYAVNMGAMKTRAELNR